jgi:pimeloyl-ACP methyl ester carboxylesterase
MYRQVEFKVACGHLNAVTAGPEEGPALVLLHGFPEFWCGWRKQISPLAEAGFRVIVPDQRGYNQSSKPAEVRDYRLRELTSDVIEIADQIGRQRIMLAGHDWGAAVAWNTAMLYPDRIEKLAILNVPHPAVMLKFLRTNPRQMLRSWYILFFRTPRLPELLFSLNGARTLIRSSRPGTFSTEDIDQYREAWSQPGALTAMINWYRALFRETPDPEAVESRISVPTRILWGMKDAFLLSAMAAESVKYCDHGELFEFPEATHWVHHEEPERVNRLLIEFFGGA